MKKKLLAILVLLCAGTALWSQSALKDWGIQVRKTWRDYSTLLQPKNTREWNTDFYNMSHGAEIGLRRGIKNYLDIIVPAKFGAAAFPLDSTRRMTSTLWGGADALFKLHWPHKKNFLAPYLVFGAGGEINNRERKGDFHLPAGIGIDFRLGQGVHLNMETQQRTSLSDFRSNIQHAVGLLLDFGGTTEPEQPKELPPADSDGDGITDDKDKCPTVAGVAALSGCPDRDGDGVADGQDQCPDQKGPMANNGCPWPDSDGDGVLDKDDRCPAEKGPATNAGCPIKDRDGDGYNDDIDDCPDVKGTVNGCPDADGDGVIDPEDKCPKVKGTPELDGCPDADGDGIADAQDKCPNKKGPRSNHGCPEIKKEDIQRLKEITRNIQFYTGKTTLKPESIVILDEIAALMKKYPEYNLSISGHTDSVGSAAANQKLSEGRAKACYDYLIKKGIDRSRMSYAGYGETQPIADNMTKEGRAKNRRVEFYMYIRK